jgi:hypothetical protein
VLRNCLCSPLVSKLALDEKNEYSKLQTKDWGNYWSIYLNAKRVKLIHVLLIIRELGRHSLVASECTKQRIECMKAMFRATDKRFCVFGYLRRWIRSYEGHWMEKIGKPPKSRWPVGLKGWNQRLIYNTILDLAMPLSCSCIKKFHNGGYLLSVEYAIGR